MLCVVFLKANDDQEAHLREYDLTAGAQRQYSTANTTTRAVHYVCELSILMQPDSTPQVSLSITFWPFAENLKSMLAFKPKCIH